MSESVQQKSHTDQCCLQHMFPGSTLEQNTHQPGLQNYIKLFLPAESRSLVGLAVTFDIGGGHQSRHSTLNSKDPSSASPSSANLAGVKQVTQSPKKPSMCMTGLNLTRRPVGLCERVFAAHPFVSLFHMPYWRQGDPNLPHVC